MISLTKCLLGVGRGPKARSSFSVQHKLLPGTHWGRMMIKNVGSALLDLKIGKCLMNEAWDQRDITCRLAVINNYMLSLPLLQTSSLLCYLFNLTWDLHSSHQCILQIFMDLGHLNMLTSNPVIEAGACYLASQYLAVFAISVVRK